jgi:hypothetical protein
MHEWGVQWMFNYPGFLEFITNRNVEDTKEGLLSPILGQDSAYLLFLGKEWHYGVIQNTLRTVHQNPSLLPTVAKVQLQKYLKQGPFFLEAEAAVEIGTKSV